MKPRLRFAPSPTGVLHIGNVRTALFNYLFARNTGGAFVLRIEDTDMERSRPEFADRIMTDLDLIGLHWDEGPYYQSKRFDLYQAHLEKLEKKDLTYPCYCTQEELQVRRREAVAQKKPARYDNRCRSLTKDEIRKKGEQGIQPVIRFKVNASEPIHVQDLIRGDVYFDPEELGDFVIMRPDPLGSGRLIPTFHMSVCIDDGLMNITHVVRGEDHLSNTPRHVLLFNALGFPVPAFAHLSLIGTSGGEPLSKRYGTMSVADFILQKGFLKEAIQNYLALLGWSPKDNREVFTPSELIDAFDISNTTRHPAVFSEEKLLWLNGEHLKMVSNDSYLERATAFLSANGFRIPNEQGVRRALLELKKDIHRFDELPQVLSFANEQVYRERIETAASAAAGELAAALKEGIPVLYSALQLTEQSAESGEQLLKRIKSDVPKSTGRKGKAVFLPIRAALTGQLHGTDLKNIFEVLGRQEIATRFQFALEQAKKL